MDQAWDAYVCTDDRDAVRGPATGTVDLEPLRRVPRWPGPDGDGRSAFGLLVALEVDRG